MEIKKRIEIFTCDLVVRIFQWSGSKLFEQRTDFYNEKGIAGVAWYSDDDLKQEIHLIRDRLNDKVD